MANKIRDRHEIPVEDTWALEDLYATDAAWEAELDSVTEDQNFLASFAGKLGSSAQNLLAYLTRMEQVDVKGNKLSTYCMCRADQDTRNTTYQAMSGKFRARLVALGAACSFETPEILAITDETMDAYYAQEPGLERYRRYLTNLRRRKDHILSPAEERILALSGEISHTPDNVFGAFSGADMTYADAVDCEGNAHPLSQGSFIRYEQSPDRVLRKSAYENIYHAFGNFKNTAAGLLNGQGKQLKFHADARRYPSTLDAALDRTNVPTSVYTNLIDAVHQNVDKLHRYVRLRKKLLGLEDLYFYDIYIPLLSQLNKQIPIDEAKQNVLASVAPLGAEYQGIMKEGFDNRWIDVYENTGKRAGAYSAGAAVHPFVLMNYADNLESQFTLAHEMGHALHSYYSNKHQNPVDSNYTIFVAEVASTCNEALLMEYLLNRTTDKDERAFLINHFLDQFKGIIYRQTMFAEFELFMGRQIGEGRTLTADLLCDEYRKLNALYYGPDMVIDDEIALEWTRIPHLYYNYYVFQYATGYSAAIALSRKILSGDEKARDAYLGFLSGGCSKSPIELLKDAGVDMTSPEPINEALKLFDELLGEMEKLTGVC